MMELTKNEKKKRKKCNSFIESNITIDKIKVDRLFKRVKELKHNIHMKKFKEKNENEKQNEIKQPELHYIKINEIIKDYLKNEKKYLSEDKKLKEEFTKFKRIKKYSTDLYIMKGKVNSFHNIENTIDDLKIKLDQFKKKVNNYKDNNSHKTIRLKKNISSSYLKENKIYISTTRNSNHLSLSNINDTNFTNNLKHNPIKRNNSLLLNNLQKKKIFLKNRLSKRSIINKPFYTSNIKDFLIELQRIKYDILKNRAIHKKYHFMSYNDIDQMMDNIYDMKIYKLKEKYLRTKFPSKNLKKSSSIKEFQIKMKKEFYLLKS